jgi:hypothetical protein
VSGGLRIAAVCVALAAATFGAVWLYRTIVRDEGPEAASPEAEELSVAEAARTPVEQTITVRGFVFLDEEAGALLCSQTTGGERPACEGDVVRLESLDTSRLALEVADEAEGGYDAWSDGEVVLLGTTLGGARLVVKDVLPS